LLSSSSSVVRVLCGIYLVVFLAVLKSDYMIFMFK
jgi:hypothetical protein